MRRILAFSSWLMMLAVLCGVVTVRAAEAQTPSEAVIQQTKELPNDIKRLEDDPAADEPDYLIKVNRATNIITVYELDDATGEFTVPVIVFACSTGKNNSTPVGEYSILKKHRWQKMFGGVYAQYAVRFMRHRLFHSVYYTRKNNNGTLSAKQYNLLGQQASSGCVRESVADAKWIFDHCKIGTPVIVYDDAEEIGPLGTPRTVTIDADSPYSGWDPIDPDPENPWAEMRPVLGLTKKIQFGETELSIPCSGKTISLPVGATKSDLESVIRLLTPEGEEYVAREYALEIYGTYDLNEPGTYEIYVRGFDLETTLRVDETFILKIRV